MKWLARIFVIISVLMMIGGITVDALAWMGKLAAEEPPVVVHLSTAALIFSGFGNVVTAVMTKKLDNN